MGEKGAVIPRLGYMQSSIYLSPKNIGLTCFIAVHRSWKPSISWKPLRCEGKLRRWPAINPQPDHTSTYSTSREIYAICRQASSKHSTRDRLRRLGSSSIATSILTRLGPDLASRKRCVKFQAMALVSDLAKRAPIQIPSVYRYSEAWAKAMPTLSHSELQ